MNDQTSGGVGRIETRGIEPVPDSERRGGPGSLFWMWFGANMGVLGITMGAALVTLYGLDLAQALLVTIAGSCGSFALVGWLSTTGRRSGAPGLTASRAVFGVRGNWGPTIVSWISFVGWETTMCTTAGFALLAVLGILGVPVTTPVIVGCILLVVTIAAVIGLLGHATIMWIQKWLTWIFGALTLAVVVLLAVTVDWPAVGALPVGGPSSVLGALGYIAAGTGLSWVAAGADYARYLPRTVSSAGLIAAVVGGAGIPLVVLITTGSLMAGSDPGLASASDPVAAIGASLPAWMLVPYLLAAAAGLIAAADLSLYSSGLNLLTGGIRITRMAAVCIDGVLVLAGGLYITVVAEDFYGPFTTFLTLLAVGLTAWAGVCAVDLATRRVYDTAGLTDTARGSTYWYTGGVNWAALGPWLIAIAAGLCFTTAAVGDDVWFAGPLAGTWLGENSMGWLVAGLTGAALHAVGRRLVGRPVETERL
ncbi:cytosine permease [Propionibacterium acidifaciens]|uniref:purine-cytosine permease family protein n=1 Tax=Propionibacterium acidifaciens TaxID=556499 RepID=UPI0023F4E726|nr:cytosine permease [Propionibacterium acidifaciens]